MSSPVQPSVQIVLATYNSEAFLQRQLESLAAQSLPAAVLVRDDGSSDGTVPLLQRWRRRRPDLMDVLSDDRGRLGPAGNFGALLQATDADLVFLCDADDVWHPTKVERMVAIAAQRPASVPLLVHSDARLIDASGAQTAPSLWEHQASRPGFDTLAGLLVRNTVTGCTAMVNRAALEAALPVPDEAVMHDWWLALVVAATGRIARTPDMLVDYRQHTGNAAGAQRLTLRRTLRLAAGAGPEHPREHLAGTFAQAAALGRSLGTAVEADRSALIRGWADMASLGPLARRHRFLRGPYRVPGAARNLGVLMSL